MKNIKIVITAAALTVFATSFGDIVKPSIKPTYSGAKQGVWTMDLETALEKAAKDGRYTLVYFSGMWWCPRCQEFEEDVLRQSAWKRFVKDRGLYLVVLDHPKRNNSSGNWGWCWLWEPSYVRSARLTPEAAVRRIIGQYGLQQMFYDSAHTAAREAMNFVVTDKGTPENPGEVFAEEPVTTYHSINYPGVLIFDPEGNEVGRFIPDATETAQNDGYMREIALDFCMKHIDAVINPTAVDALMGDWALAFSESGSSGYGSLSITVAAKGKVKFSGFRPDGTKISTTSTLVTGAKSCYIPVRFNKKDSDPAFVLRIDNATGDVKLENANGIYLVALERAGKTLPQKIHCTLGNFPTEIGGFEVVPDSVPEGFDFTVKGNSMTDAFKVKFTYSPKTGAVKGKFNVYVLKRGRPTKVTVTVQGIMSEDSGDIGFGTAIPKGGASAAVVFKKGESDCGECGL